jgi:hypothetical protein
MRLQRMQCWLSDARQLVLKAYCGCMKPHWGLMSQMLLSFCANIELLEVVCMWDCCTCCGLRCSHQGKVSVTHKPQLLPEGNN